jgi:diaminohydroxyphosphoribosylaminopyrimidine deaminase/5-amino-6-(5-phosphoribosylamino)uracil reductase
MRLGRPWVRVKSAISLDGRIALQNGESKWISSEASRRDVQQWRARSSAIMTGIGTVLADDPSMDARVSVDVQQPLKVVVDSRWRIPLDSRILAQPERVVIAGDASIPVPGELAGSGAHCLRIESVGGAVSLETLLADLAGLEVNEVQVEAGSRLCGSLLRARLVDEMLIYQAPLLLGDGGAGPFALGPLESMADRTHLTMLESVHFGDDLRLRFQPQVRD